LQRYHRILKLEQIASHEFSPRPLLVVLPSFPASLGIRSACERGLYNHGHDRGDSTDCRADERGDCTRHDTPGTDLCGIVRS